MADVKHLIEVHGLKKTYQSGDTRVEAVRNMDFFI